MKKIVTILLCIVLMLSLATSVLAHSGGTDGDGGHYNHSTGEYHYHHGYPAHSHKNGICPYTQSDDKNEDVLSKVVLLGIGVAVVILILRPIIKK